MTFEEYKQNAFQKDPALYDDYKALEPEYELIASVIRIRSEKRITQKDLAERIGIRQSNISRFESGTYNPTLDFLKKIARGLDKKLYIEFR